MGKKSLPLPGESGGSNSVGQGLSGGIGGPGGLAGQTGVGPGGGMANSSVGGGGSALAGGAGGSLLLEDGQPSTLSSEDLLVSTLILSPFLFDCCHNDHWYQGVWRSSAGVTDASVHYVSFQKGTFHE